MNMYSTAVPCQLLGVSGSESGWAADFTFEHADVFYGDWPSVLASFLPGVGSHPYNQSATSLLASPRHSRILEGPSFRHSDSATYSPR